MLDSDYDPAGFGDVVDRVDRVLYLRALSFLAGLNAQDLQFVGGHLRQRSFSAGELLLKEGQPVGAIHLIVEGSVQVQRRGVALRDFGPRDAVGVYGLLAQTPEGVQATAQSETHTLELRADALREIFEERFGIFANTLQRLGGDLMGERKRIPGNAGLPSQVEGAPSCPTRPLDLVERMFFLRQSAAFADAEVFGVAALARAATERRFSPGEIIWRRGDVANDVLFLASGTIEGTVEEASQSFIFSPGETVGGADAVAGRKRWYTTQAVDSAVGLSIPTPALLDVFEDHLNVGVVFISFFARRILGAFERRAALGAAAGDHDAGRAVGAAGSVPR